MGDIWVHSEPVYPGMGGFFHSLDDLVTLMFSSEEQPDTLLLLHPLQRFLSSLLPNATPQPPRKRGTRLLTRVEVVYLMTRRASQLLSLLRPSVVLRN